MADRPARASSVLPTMATRQKVHMHAESHSGIRSGVAHVQRGPNPLFFSLGAERPNGTPLLRRHSHRAAQDDGAVALAQVLVLILAAIGLGCWVAARLFPTS